LERAAKLNPLPDYQWVLSEALHAAGRNEEAQQVEQELVKKGGVSDPRTFALYLASSGKSPALALELAQAELNTRGDVFTHDALAWALAVNGRSQEAWQEMQLALAEGTQDARLYFHAALLALQAGQTEAAQPWLNKATSMLPLLLPSEQKQLLRTMEDSGQSDKEDTASAPGAPTLFTSGNQ
jgi:tetratricopeptide (TPR) repeat protein